MRRKRYLLPPCGPVTDAEAEKTLHRVAEGVKKNGLKPDLDSPGAVLFGADGKIAGQDIVVSRGPAVWIDTVRAKAFLYHHGQRELWEEDLPRAPCVKAGRAAAEAFKDRAGSIPKTASLYEVAMGLLGYREDEIPPAV